jgi:hypothetical protein
MVSILILKEEVSALSEIFLQQYFEQKKEQESETASYDSED